MNKKIIPIIFILILGLFLVGCVEENKDTTDFESSSKAPVESSEIESPTVEETASTNNENTDMSKYYLEKARLGNLKLTMSLEDVEKIIGKPSKKNKEQYEEASFLYVSEYIYSDIGLRLFISRKDNKSDKYELHQINTLENCKMETEKGIKLGDSLSKFKSVYEGMFRTNEFDSNGYSVGGKDYTKGGTGYFFKDDILVEIIISHGHLN